MADATFSEQVKATWDWLFGNQKDAMAETFPGPQPTDEVINKAIDDTNAATHQGLPTLSDFHWQSIWDWIKGVGIWVVIAIAAVAFILLLPELIGYGRRLKKAVD